MSKIITSNFLNSLPEGNILLLFINDEEICFAAADKYNFSYSAFDTIKISADTSIETLLREAIQNSEILSPANYRKVIFCSGYRKSTIIPVALFDDADLKAQLQFSADFDENDEILTDDIPYLQAINVFAISGAIINILSEHYNNLEVHHSSTALITYLLANKDQQNRKSIMVIVHETYMEIIVTEGSQLIFYNTFSFYNPEEFIYYVLFVCEQLGVSPQDANIQLSGKITGESECFSLATKYFSNASLTPRPDNFIYPQEFEILPDTFHYYLFSQLICAS